MTQQAKAEAPNDNPVDMWPSMSGWLGDSRRIEAAGWSFPVALR